MPRRDFMRTSMGMATAFLASNMVYGPNWDVDEAETLEPAATEEKFPKGEYFIIDVQTHFTDGVAIGFRKAEFVRNMGFDLEGQSRCLQLHQLRQGDLLRQRNQHRRDLRRSRRETNKNLAGKVLEGRDRRGGILPSWLMSQRKNELNELAGGTRAFCQGNCAPNHYWDRETNSPDFPALFEQMEREVKTVRHRQLEVVLPHRSRAARATAFGWTTKRWPIRSMKSPRSWA